MADLRIKQLHYQETEPTDAIIGDFWADDRIALNVKTVFDLVHPVGSYALGKKPLYGTWVQLTGDEALWIKNDVADGTVISQALPKPQIAHSMSSTAGKHDHYWQGYRTRGSASSGKKVVSQEWISTDPLELCAEADGAHTHSYTITMDASTVYGDGTKVQPDAYVMAIWKRTA